MSPPEEFQWFAENLQPHEPALRACLASRFPWLRELPVLEEAPGVGGILDERQRQEILAEALASLPERCREVVQLRFPENLSYKEIAARLGVTTVKVQLGRGIRRCAKFFAARDLLEPALPSPVHRFRTAFWVPLAAAAAIMLAFVWWRSEQGNPHARYATVAGALQRVTLPDGSAITLNASSEASVQYSAQECRVRLAAGEAHCEVAHDAARPFPGRRRARKCITCRPAMPRRRSRSSPGAPATRLYNGRECPRRENAALPQGI